MSNLELNYLKNSNKMNNLVKKYNLDKSTWTHKGFHGVLHTFFPVGQSGFPMKKYFQDCSRITLFFMKDNYVHWYWNDADLTRIRDKFFKRLRKNSNYLKNLKKLWEKSIGNFDIIIKKVQGINLEMLSNKELSSLYNDFYKKYLDEFSYFMALGDSVSMHADKYLVPEFEKTLKDNFSKIFPQLITTKYKSFIEKEYEDRLKLIKLSKNNKNIFHKALEKHSNKYFYIQNNYARGDYLNAKDFEKLIKEDTKTKKSNRIYKNNIIKKYKISAWNQKLLYVMDEFFGIQDDRKKYVLISNYYQFRFLKELSRRTKIPFKSLQYSIYPEYHNILGGKFNKEVFEKRKKLSVCIQTSQSYQILTGSEARELFKYFSNLEKDKNIIKGIVASGGKIKGRVKIILKTHDMVNMHKGDILISSMTRPEMIPAIKNASAIITDEGGITCHAAIISRELKIPCIIGTKVATKVLKDGDFIEVDAENGVVKKL